MLDYLVVVFILLAFIFMFLGIENFKEKDYYWSFVCTLISIFIWFLLSASILETEAPWEMFNGTSGNIETGVNVYASKIAPELVYFFYMMAMINIIFEVLQVFVAVGSLFKKRRGR